MIETHRMIDALEPRTLFANLVPVLINAGGAQFVDTIGRTFIADTGATGGHIVQAALPDVANTTDDPLFVDSRAGAAFSYAIPVANGHYALWLEFADPTSSSAGQRKFNVTAQSVQILNNFDIAAATDGANIATAKAFDVNVTNGTLALTFTGTVNEAIVSAIAVVPTDIPTDALPYTSLPLSDAAKLTSSLSKLREIYQYSVAFYAAEHKGALPPDLATLRTSDGAPEYLFADPRTSTAFPRGEISELEGTAWIASRTDYIYLGAGKRSNMPADTVVAYENPNRVTGDIGIVRGDGYATNLDRATAAAMIGFANTPPSDPPPAPPTIPPADPLVVQSRQNLQKIATALQQHSNFDHGKYPVDLGTLYSDGLITDVHVFIDPRGSTQAPPDTATDAQKIAFINACSDYLYAGAGLRTSTFDSWLPVISENPAQIPGALDLLFGDGRVDYRERRWANDTLRRHRPSVVSASSAFQFTSSPPLLNFTFATGGISGATVQLGDLSLLNLDTNQPISTAGMTVNYSVAAKSAQFVFSASQIATLPDGNYRATLPAGSVADAFGNVLENSANIDFFLLRGDADQNRIVDTADFTQLAMFFNQTFANLGKGDFNCDGVVNALDFNALASNFGATLAPPPASAAMVGAFVPRPDLFSQRPAIAADEIL